MAARTSHHQGQPRPTKAVSATSHAYRSSSHRGSAESAEHEAKIVKCFRCFDINNDGVISRDELAAVLRKLDTNNQLGSSEIDELVRSYDKSGDGHFQYEEFSAWILGNHSASLMDGVDHLLNAETPEQKLERYHKKALPSKPVEVWFQVIHRQDALLRMFKDGADDPRKEAQGKRFDEVIAMGPTGHDSVRKGVRVGWRVVQVGDKNSLKKNLSIPEQIIRETGGAAGDSTKKGVTVKFISRQAIEAHEAAIKALPSIQQEVEQEAARTREKEAAAKEASAKEASAATATESAVVDVALPDCITVKYYSYTVSVPILNGCALANDIDIMLSISDIMPGSKLHLAKTLAGDQNIVSPGEVISGLPNRVARDGDGFQGLIAGQAYFLVVEQPSGISHSDLQWRDRMRKERETERLASLRPHDCQKEQVPLLLHVSTSRTDFEVTIDNTARQILGLDTWGDIQAKCLKVQEVAEFGIFNWWNHVCPSHKIQEGDQIMQINGACDNVDLLEEELHKPTILRMRICRVSYEEGDHVRGLRSNGNWYDAVIERCHGDGSFALRWHDGSHAEKLKWANDLRKEILDDQSLNKTKGEYKFIGAANFRPQYRNDAGSMLCFRDEWQIKLSDERSPSFVGAGENGLRPPMGSCWRCPFNPGMMVDVNRVGTIGCMYCSLSLALM